MGKRWAGMPSEVKEINTTITGTIDIEWEAALRKAFPKGEAAVVDVEVVGGKADSGEPKAQIGNGGTP